MKYIFYLAAVLVGGLGAQQIPDDVGKFADEHMERYVSKQGQSLSSGERSVKEEADVKKGAISYDFHYRFSHGTFGCTITVSKKKEKLTVTKKPSCYENPMP